MPRGVLTIMGSGETSPTMVTPHQHLLKRYGSEVRAVIIDSPAGFQENVGELTDKAIAYFAESVGVDVGRVSFRSAAETSSAPVEHAAAMQRLRAADWVFAGPGSPSYALRTWARSAVPEALRGVVDSGGTVVMASAASLTLGAFTVPVYEVYKVGEDPRWLEGLDLLGHATGWRAAVIPHFDNTDGGTTHDTRFCYLGLTRLEAMERELPDDAFILGIDEHTGLVLDLDDQTASIVGRGVVTLRVRGRQRTLSAGTSEPLATIDAWLAEALRDGGASEPLVPRVAAPTVVTDATPLPGDLAEALAVVIERDRHASSDDERAAVRAALAELAGRSGSAVDERSLVAPFVEALLSLRAAARADKRWADADAARDALVACGVEVRDTADGVEWDLRH